MKKIKKIIALTLCCGLLSSALVFGMDVEHVDASTTKAHVYYASELGFSFTDRLIKDDSIEKSIQTSVEFDDDVIFYSYLNVGIKDGATKNTDFTQIPSANGMANGISACAGVINGSQGSAWTNTVKNGSGSSKASIKHSSSKLRYSINMTY